MSAPAGQSVDHVILVLPFTPSSYLQPAPLLPLIPSAVTSATKSLTVLLHTPAAPARRRSSALALSYETPTIDPTKQLFSRLRRNPKANWDGLHAFLGKLYGTLVGAAFKEGKVLLRTEVLFENEDGSVLYDLLRSTPGARVVQIEGSELQLPPNTLSSTLPAPTFALSTWTPPPPSQGFPVVALGGTFDHLHGAHRLLLQLSAFLCTRKLIVGVTSASLLTNKSNASLVESLAERKARVEDFLSRIGVSRTEAPVMDVVEISDPFGPTAHDPDIQALVVSRETISGADEIAKLRKEKDLPALEVFIIDVLSSQQAEGQSDLRDATDEKALKEAKMGSTGIRKWIAEHPNEN